MAWWLRVQKGFDAKQAKRLAAAVEPIFKTYPHWAVNAAQERELRKQIYQAFINAGVKDVVVWVDDMLTLLRRVAE